MRSTKQLVGKEGKQKLLLGINKMANAVKSTLGPAGRNVLIQDEYGNVRSTKDGVTVAKNLYLEDNVENLAATVLREVSVKTNDVAGDGTTTAMVLAQRIINESMALLTTTPEAAVELKKEIDSDIEKVCNHIDTLKTPVTLQDEFALTAVATISANNDAEIGKILAEAFISVGQNGIVTVQEGRGFETYFERTQGVSFSRGYISASFINNQRDRSCVLEDCDIVLVGEKIIEVDPLFNHLQVLTQRSSTRRPVLLICEDIDEKILSLLIVNKMKGLIDLCVIKSPGMNFDRKELIQDLAVAVGGKVISKELNYGFEMASVTDSTGHADQVKITDNNTAIIGGRRNEREFNERIDVLKGNIEATEEQFLKDKIAERIAKLTGGIGIIYAGGASELEIKEKIDRIDDGIHAVQAALEDGIVPGGGAALLKCSHLIENKVVAKALVSPLFEMLLNAGMDASRAETTVRAVQASTNNSGFNVKTFRHIDDMISEGIIDSAKVVKTALKNAGSVAGLFITTEYVIANSEYKSEIM